MDPLCSVDLSLNSGIFELIVFVAALAVSYFLEP